EAAVLAAKKAKEAPLPCGCPGSACQSVPQTMSSQLKNFPVQIKLLPPNAPYFDGADLLIAADCTAYSYGNFHQDFMRDKVTMIGCPKLDAVDYSEKLTQILKHNDIRSITVTRMTVPCCGGLSYAVKTAIENCGKNIPLHIVTISPDGKIV
ncbi:MAG: ferredoxin, partial [Oscillospiraceae bacterium]|nr:ferredoxin [Oscillospiraceae bacterium]